MGVKERQKRGRKESRALLSQSRVNVLPGESLDCCFFSSTATKCIEKLKKIEESASARETNRSAREAKTNKGTAHVNKRGTKQGNFI